MKTTTDALVIYSDGREVCRDNTKAGWIVYKGRVEEMRVRQEELCCLEAYAPMCPGPLGASEATFEHEHGRGMGGAKRDDRTELPDGTWINGAAHEACNLWKGSRYIDYNRSFQPRRGDVGPALGLEQDRVPAGDEADTGEALAC